MNSLARGGMAWSWLGLFVAAQLADVITTVASLRLGGVESNPLVLSLISGSGMSGYASVKLSAIAVGVGLFCLADWLRSLLPDGLAHRVSRTFVVGLQVGVAVQLFAVIANLVALGGEIRT